MSLPQRFIARGSCKSLLQIVTVSGKVQKHIHNAVNQLRRYLSLAQEMLLSEMNLGIFLRLRVRIEEANEETDEFFLFHPDGSRDGHRWAVGTGSSRPPVLPFILLAWDNLAEK